MHRRTILAFGLATATGCTQAPGTPPAAGIRFFHLGAFSLPIGTDPVMTSVIVSSSYLADPPARLAGRPALAAQTVAQYEFATVGLDDLRFVGLNPMTQPMMARGRAALRETIGIRADAPPPVVIEGMTQVAGALQREDRAAAEATLARMPLTRPPADALAVLSAMPRVPEANRASSFALQELTRPGSPTIWCSC
jgi:hypothetical protein